MREDWCICRGATRWILMNRIVHLDLWRTWKIARFPFYFPRRRRESPFAQVTLQFCGTFWFREIPLDPFLKIPASRSSPDVLSSKNKWHVASIARERRDASSRNAWILMLNHRRFRIWFEIDFGHAKWIDDICRLYPAVVLLLASNHFGTSAWQSSALTR